MSIHNDITAKLCKDAKYCMPDLYVVVK